MRGHRCGWLHHSRVYHRTRPLTWTVRKSWGGEVGCAPCGVVLSSGRFRFMEGSEHQARLLGLRPCKRCFRAQPSRTEPL